MKKTSDELLGYVKAGRYRKKILLVLKSEHDLCPREIADEINYTLSHTSNTLTELNKFGLIKCKNPNARKGRLYCLTKIGQTICEKLGPK